MSTAIAGSLAATPAYLTASDQLVLWDDPGQTWRQVLTSGAPLGPGGGGTGTSTVFTAGSVVFAGPGGVYAQDNANLFWDDTANRLGVGTAAPRGTLEGVYAVAPPTPLSTAVSGGLVIGDGSFVGAQIGIMNNAGNYDTFIQARHQGTASVAYRVLLNPLGGNVGIGTATPTQALDVAGMLALNGGTVLAASAPNAGYTFLYNNGNRVAIQIGADGFDPTMYLRQGSYLFQDAAAAVNYCIFNAAATYNVSGAWAVISGREMKQEIAPYERGLDAIVQLQPCVFRYRAGTPFARGDAASDVQIGLIAEEVEPVMPELVGRTTAMVGKEEVAVASLTAGNALYAVINALKEVATRLDALEARIGA